MTRMLSRWLRQRFVSVVVLAVIVVCLLFVDRAESFWPPSPSQASHVSQRRNSKSSPRSKRVCHCRRRSLQTHQGDDDYCVTGLLGESTTTSRRRFMTANLKLVGAFSIATTTETLASSARAEPDAEVEASSSHTDTTQQHDREIQPVQPFAPTLLNLLPATRVRRWIEQSYNVATQIAAVTTTPAQSDTTAVAAGSEGASKSTKTTTRRQAYIQELTDLLLSPPTFTVSLEEVQASRKYLDVPSLEDWNRAQEQSRKQTDALLSRGKFSGGGGGGGVVSDGGVVPALVEPFLNANKKVEQWGEIRQFLRLQREQLRLEASNPIRAAFNAYSNNLVYGNTYQLTIASKQERSRRIRADALPDIDSVIRSDLDLRDLYRNEVLEAMDNAQAELTYQLKQETFNGADLLDILTTAKSSCDKWFNFVPVQDAKEAILVLDSIKE